MPFRWLNRINVGLSFLIRSLILLICLSVAFSIGFLGFLFWNNTRDPYYGPTFSHFYTVNQDGTTALADPTLVLANAGQSLLIGRTVCAHHVLHTTVYKKLVDVHQIDWPVPNSTPDRILLAGCHPRAAPTIMPTGVPVSGFYWYVLQYDTDMPSPELGLIQTARPVLIWLNQDGEETLNLQQAIALMKAHPELVPPEPKQ